MAESQPAHEPQLPVFEYNVSGPIDFSKTCDYSVLKDKTAIVTGGSGGIGEGSVRALAKEGVYTVVADVNKEQGEKLAEELNAAGYHAKFVHADVSNWDSLLAAFKETVAFSPHKTIDIVMANAGISGSEAFFNPRAGEDPTPPNMKVMDVNLYGVLYTVKLALHYFSQPSSSPLPGRKSIMVVSSLGGYSDMQYATLYNSSKFGVRGVFKSLRNAIPKATMRINLLAPSWVKTNMTARAVPFLEKLGAEFADMSTVQEAILRFCADDTINGRAVAVTGRGNYDLCDDRANFDAGEMIQKLVKDGAIA